MPSSRTPASRRGAVKDACAEIAARQNIFAAIEAPETAALQMSSELLDFMDAEVTRTIRRARDAAFKGYPGRRPRMDPEIRAEINAAVDFFGLSVHDGLLSYLNTTRGNIEADLSRGASIENLMAAFDTERAAKLFRDALTNLMSRAANSLLQQIDTLVYTDALADRALLENKDPADQRLRWNTMDDARVCEDCSPRDDEVKTLGEWTAAGLPGSPILLCSSFGRSQCRCSLDPV